MTLSNIFASLPKVYLRSNTVNKTSFKAQFLTLAAPGSACCTVHANTQCGRWQNVFESVFVFSYLRLCPKCIWDQIQLTKPVSKHNFNPILCRWWWWRFRWSDATPLPTADRGKDKCSSYLQTIFGGTFGFKGAANEKFGVQWEIWNKRPNLAPGGVLNCGENL